MNQNVKKSQDRLLAIVNIIADILKGMIFSILLFMGRC